MNTKMDRSTFLRRVGLGLFTSLAARSVFAGEAAQKPRTPSTAAAALDFSDWDAVRAQSSLAPGIGYFNNGGLGVMSLPALEACVSTTRANQAQADTGHDSFPVARKILARYLDADPEEVCFTRNTSEGNSIIACGLALAPGDEVIMESHSHPGGSYPWYNQKNLRGIVVRIFEPDPLGPKGNVERIEALITPRTRVIQVSHVTAPTGIVLPVRQIAALARAHGIWFHVDAAQSVGMFPFSLRDLGCDSLATSGHKWLCGPRETGILYIRRDRNDAVRPSGVGARSGRLPFLPGEFTWVDTAQRHEYGSRDAAAVEGLAAAALFQEKVGRERLATYGRGLAAQVRQGLATIPGLDILSPSTPEMQSQMATFRTKRIEFAEIYRKLRTDYGMTCRSVDEQGINAVRVSVHWYNTPEECDRLVAAVARIVANA